MGEVTSMDEEKIIESIATLKTEVKHINKHIGGIDASMKKLQEVVVEQIDLRNEMTVALKEHSAMKLELSGYGKRLSDNEKQTTELKNLFINNPMKIKANLVDYVWKYAALAIGGWIALKVTGILP